MLAEADLEGQDIKFDTIPRAAMEAVRKAYITILDDPTEIAALKKELGSGEG